ncbi:MAG: Primosome assembly protein PriA [candidate division TM6 bacterium GW2011_GWE2_42_60]|nr:MAG: Primosome assembly protein PriA [candidate division TM6 bacterium GW2011_GWE2_42_60]HBY05839.1 primosomal protein N' [Candidatus Dependentiae bacterium]
MYATVQLLNGFQQTLTYKIPDQWDHTTLFGALVTVPLQRRREKAVVIEICDHTPKNSTFTIRELLTRDPFPKDTHFQPFLESLAHYYQLPSFIFYRRLRSFLNQKSKGFEAPQHEEPRALQQVILTAEQETIVDALTPSIVAGGFEASLIHGVTGSGKTEVYKHLILAALKNKKSVILLLPEVSLAVRFGHYFREAFKTNYPVFGFHSATGALEKKALWMHLMRQQPVLIIGVHLPILLPLENLGLIVIDEEHESGYQEKKHPKFNSKEIALMRAQKYAIPIVLGSATPSLQSLYNTHHKNWRLFSLTKRFAGAFPKVEHILLKNDDKRASFWLSKELEKAIENRLEKREQSIIFLNRRGFSFFIQCADCGHIFQCHSCSVSLTLHFSQTQEASLRCHYCGHQEPEPQKCPQCGPRSKLLKKGIGTQQVVSLLQKRFPHARIARADMDTTVDRKEWESTLTQFTQREIDIMVGTQTITKGYHFPHVTLVGILWGDINLSIPFFNAAEVALQQLIQVAGRAGRQSAESLVIVQTLTKHPIFTFINEQDYLSFCEYEKNFREKLNYPPFVRFAEIELRNTDEAVLMRDAQACSLLLRNLIAQEINSLVILGPAEPPVYKVKNIFIRKIYLKSSSFALIHKAYQELKKQKLDSNMFYTPNPVS